MKKIITLAIATVFLFTACEGPEGPMGPPGEPGGETIGETFEYANVNLNDANNYSFTASFDPALFDGDVMLVYRLEAVDNGTDVWEPLPTAFYYNTDTGDDLQYRYNFTNGDVLIAAESSNHSAFGPEFFSNQVFRVVIVPSELMNTVDKSNIDAVMKAANIKSVQKLQ